MFFPPISRFILRIFGTSGCSFGITGNESEKPQPTSTSISNNCTQTSVRVYSIPTPFGTSLNPPRSNCTLGAWAELDQPGDRRNARGADRLHPQAFAQKKWRAGGGTGRGVRRPKLHSLAFWATFFWAFGVVLALV